MEKENQTQNICPHMNGEKCAGEYCDYYDRYRQKCSLAIECKLNVELLAKRVKKNRAVASQKKRDQEIRDYMTKKNIVPTRRTVQ
jgi:hypothetical protein